MMSCFLYLKKIFFPYIKRKFIQKLNKLDEGFLQSIMTLNLTCSPHQIGRRKSVKNTREKIIISLLVFF